MYGQSKVKTIFFLIAGIMLFNMQGFTAMGKNAIPDTIVSEGTKYVNCMPHADYPYQTSEKTIILSGEAKEETGSRTRPWLGMSVNDKLLFNSKDKTLIYCPAMIGKTLQVKGYPGMGIVKVKDYFSQEVRTQIFQNAFFVTEIVGWVYIMGYPVNKLSGEISPVPTNLWIQAESEVTAVNENHDGPTIDSKDYFDRQLNTYEEKE